MFASRSSATSKAPAPPPQSIEAVRQRARHRLIGAAVLVLLGVVGFPLLFDTEPRPISVDIPIEIPSKTPKPALPAAPVVQEVVKGAPPPVEAGVAANESLSEREEVVAPEPPGLVPRPTDKPLNPPSEKPAVKAAERPAEKPPEKPVAATPVPAQAASAKADAERARALLQGKPDPDKPVASKPAGAERLVIQVGAFAEAAGAREVRMKLERAGLKTYTHVAETSQGQRTRVRVGPFDNRADAEKAAARVKALGLPAAILTL